MSGPVPEAPLTVGALIELLSRFQPSLPVIAVYDCGCAHGDVVAVERGVSDDRPVVNLEVN